MPQGAHVWEKQLTRTARLHYLLSLPGEYGRDQTIRWPLILFLHGAGERGDQVENVAAHGIPRVIARGDALPFITVSPQCPNRTTWLFHVDALLGLLDEVVATYAVDPQRVYLTGLSMGGNGAWHLATAFPRRFAAVAPICGWGEWWQDFPEAVCALKDVPVWAFHGALDDVVPLSGPQVLVDTLRACGGNVRLTVYPAADHDSWTATYDNPELYRWLLSQHQGEGPSGGDPQGRDDAERAD